MTVVGAVLRVARPLGSALRPAERSAGPRAAVAAGPTLPAGRDPDGLSRWQAEHAEWRVGALRPTDRRAVQAALAAAAPHARPYLRRAIAAHRPAADVLRLAHTLSTHPAGWADLHLRLVDARPGPQCRFGTPIAQADPTSCGSAVLLVLAAETDPLAALELTGPPEDPDGAGFGGRWVRRQRAVHRQSNRAWPGRLGTTPWGMTGWLRRHAPGAGPYRVRLVDDTDQRDMAAVTAQVGTALGEASPVPLLVGAGVPRHWVLVLRRDGWSDDSPWLVYEPGGGRVHAVPPAAVAERRPAEWLGFDRLHGVLLPGG